MLGRWFVRAAALAGQMRVPVVTEPFVRVPEDRLQ
jgi:hypothetical protein